MTLNLYSLIDRLIALTLERELLHPMDEVYVRNRLLALFKDSSYETATPLDTDLYTTLDYLTDYALDHHLISDTSADRDIFSSTIMDVFLDKPSIINQNFYDKYETSPKKATSYFYELSRLVNYIKVNRILKNEQFTTQSPYGPIEITINLSKPEKDPKEIALMKSAPPNKYPSCLLCKENEGYEGTLTLPDRANHRMIRLSLNNQKWMMQYSPYLYYNEHCIILSDTHRPMTISKNTFSHLLDFTSLFPHYFIGSNADLPIVGGSILSHEHYQGGNYSFPIDFATHLFGFNFSAYPSISGSILNWPLSTIELRSKDKSALTDCSDMILTHWKQYSDPSHHILAYTESTPHNTITPICKRDGEDYILRLVLRNNRTTPEHPLGIFHPHTDVHHIKKENIGLIEVMGLAILPGRLLDEIESIKSYICDEATSIPDYHLEFANHLKAHFTPTTPIDSYIKQAIGDKFTRVLEDSGVYKLDPHGIDGFKKFITHIGAHLL